MENDGLKAVLDASTEELAAAVLGETNQRADEANTEAQPEPIDILANLNERDRTIVNTFSNAEWMNVCFKLLEGGDVTKLQAAVRDVADKLAPAVLEATMKQYDAKEAAELNIPAEPPRVTALDKVNDMARWTPLRLTWAERELLKLLESTLYISDYTDNVDIYHSGSKNKQIVKQIRQICSILSGLVIARDYEAGQRLLKDRDFRNLASFFQMVFEVGRRYKQLNPERMRDSYGKLMYFLMDSRMDAISNMLGFDCVCPVRTVYDFLERKNRGRELLRDPLLVVATKEIYTEGLTRYQVQLLQNEKEEATKQLIHKYAEQKSASKPRSWGLFSTLVQWSSNEEESVGRLEDPQGQNWNSSTMTEDDVELAIYSLKDHMTFLRYNERPVDMMLRYLEHYFDPDHSTPETCLSITAAYEGARLSHDHGRQYAYVKQSLLLWREVQRNFLRLWALADQDLLDADRQYKLQHTGQGLNRVQPCPRVGRAFTEILANVQRQAGRWIGSSAVHLGDRNVPNALMFIDKYTQVPRIINPVIQVLESIPKLAQSYREVKELIDNSGGQDRLRLYILRDFFRHAFDGSGADNFFDAGSCIDGRLTSAWNWCSTIEKKPYYPIFLLSGFTGFDGKF